MRERKSAPPLKHPGLSGAALFKARDMPDFSRGAFKPIKDSGELTIPEGFALKSLERHNSAKRQQHEKLEQQKKEMVQAREFKSHAMPDYESKQLCIMPSGKPSTVAVRPDFASDALPKREVKISPKRSDSPRQFVF